MRVVQLTPLAKARVWFEGGVSEFAPAGSIKREVEADPNAFLATTHLTLEAFVPRGARAEFGLLGVKFEREGDRLLQLEVPYSKEANNRWFDSLAVAIDDVRLGLPSEYVPAILDAAVDSGTRRFPPGSIRIVQAAHGLIGSSSEFFQKLTICALELMCNERLHASELMASFLRERLAP